MLKTNSYIQYSICRKIQKIKWENSKSLLLAGKACVYIEIKPLLPWNKNIVKEILQKSKKNLSCLLKIKKIKNKNYYNWNYFSSFWLKSHLPSEISCCICFHNFFCIFILFYKGSVYDYVRSACHTHTHTQKHLPKRNKSDHMMGKIAG